MHRLHITAHGFCTGGHGAIDPGTDFDRGSALDIATKTGRYLDGQRQFARTHTPIHVGIVADHRFLDEIPRA